MKKKETGSGKTTKEGSMDAKSREDDSANKMSDKEEKRLGKALIKAVSKRKAEDIDLEEVRRLIEDEKAPVNFGKGDEPVLVCASQIKHNAKVLEMLLGAGAEADIPDYMDRRPLMFASFIGDIEMMQVLIRYGANPKLKCKRNMSAMDFAQTNEARVVLKGAGA